MQWNFPKCWFTFGSSACKYMLEECCTTCTLEKTERQALSGRLKDAAGEIVSLAQHEVSLQL